jgi:HAD superfamily hydrolase (TIGR01509 family)
MFSAIIFDFDGTLVNSLDEHIRSWKKAFDELGVELLEKEIRRKFGKPSTTILSEVLPLRLHGKIGELTKRKQQYFMEQSTSLRLYPGVEKVLKKLKERGMPMAVATSMNRKGLHSALQALGIEKYFDVVITVEDVTRGKPAPEMLLRAAEKLGQEIKRCLMVGDSLFDVLAAERAGMSVVVVANNPYQIEQIREKGVRVVEKIAEILHFL